MSYRKELLEKILAYENLKIKAERLAGVFNSEAEHSKSVSDFKNYYWSLSRVSINYAIAQRIDNRIKALIKQL